MDSAAPTPPKQSTPTVVSEVGRVTISVPGMFADPADPTANRIVPLLMEIPGVTAVEIRRGQGASIVLGSKTTPTPEQLRAIADSFRAVSPAPVVLAPAPVAPADTAVAPSEGRSEQPVAPESGGLRTRNNALLGVFIPLTLLLEQQDAPPLVTFLAAAICLIPLASLLEKATASLAAASGTTVGALLNSTLGNLPGIIIGLTALQKGLDVVVKGAIVGTVVGSLLLSLGAAMFLGGFRRAIPKFNTLSVGVSGNLLVLGVVGLLVPLLFNLTDSGSKTEISLEIAAVLLVTYLLSFVFSLITHKSYLGTAMEGHEAAVSATPHWGVPKALVVLAATAAVLVVVSDMLTGALAPAAKEIGLSDVFAGMFLLAAAANMPEMLKVVSFARKGNMGLAFNVTLQSCTQMVVFVAPLLVFVSFFTGGTLNLVFAPFAAVGLVLTVLAIRGLLTDGETNWLEGMFLIALYVLLGIGVFNLPVK